MDIKWDDIYLMIIIIIIIEEQCTLPTIHPPQHTTLNFRYI